MSLLLYSPSLLFLINSPFAGGIENSVCNLYSSY